MNAATCDTSAINARSGAPAPNESPPGAGMERTAQVVWQHFVTPNVKKVVICLTDQGIVSAAGFATSVMIGRFVSPAELGVYYLALSVLVFARGLQEQMISTPYIIYRHRYKDHDLAKYNGSCLAHQLTLAALTVAGLLLMTLVAALGWMGSHMLPTLTVLTLIAPILLMREYVRQYCFAHMRMMTALGVDAVVTTLQVAGLVLLASSGRLSAANAYILIGVCCGMAMLLWCRRARPVLQFRLHRFLPDWRRNWSFAKWALAGQLVGSSSTYLLPWILMHARGADATGLFAAGFTLVGLANVFMMGMANYLTPKAAHAYANEGTAGLWRVLKGTSLLLLITLGSFFLFVLLVGGQIVVLVYGAAYADMQPVMAVLALSLMINSLNIVASNGLYAMERMRDNFIADICLMGASLLAAVVLTYPYGLMGAAIASLIGTSVGAVARSFIVLRLMRPTRKALQVS